MKYNSTDLHLDQVLGRRHIGQGTEHHAVHQHRRHAGEARDPEAGALVALGERRTGEGVRDGVAVGLVVVEAIRHVLVVLAALGLGQGRQSQQQTGAQQHE